MSRPVLLVLGEGPHEIGRTPGILSSSDPLPSLPALIHRILGEPEEITYKTALFRRAVHAHGHGFTKKVQAAMRIARTAGAGGLAVVVDRDGPNNVKRLIDLQKGRDELPATLGVPCAVGVAVEAFDAWMIADGKAMSAAAGAAAQGHQDPESLTSQEAKTYASTQLADGHSGKYARVALGADLALLRQRCPKGFKPFAQEVQQRLLAVVGTRTGNPDCP